MLLLYILTPPQFICPGPATDNKYLSTELSMLTLVRWCQNRQIMSYQGIQLQFRRNGGAMELLIRMTRKDIKA